MKVAVLQLHSQGMSSTKLYKYIRIAHTKGVELLLLGEYVLNSFFKELQSMSVSMIEEQALHHMHTLKELSHDYNITIVAPLILVKKKKLYKSVVKFSPSSTSYYHQQILINYKHWNEEKFFSNEKSPIITPMIFKISGLKFAVISGFELHFDTIFEKLQNKKIDAILVPSVATFESYERWEKLISMRAFTHNCYVLRANRIGEYQDSEFDWKFYGDSILASPHGELLNHLGNKEELLIADIHHNDVMQAKKTWGFEDTLKKRIQK